MHIVAFLREEGGARSATEGERGIMDMRSPHFELWNIVAQAPSDAFGASSLPEGASEKSAPVVNDRCNFDFKFQFESKR